MYLFDRELLRRDRSRLRDEDLYRLLVLDRDLDFDRCLLRLLDLEDLFQ